jgi:hypothetical protein
MMTRVLRNISAVLFLGALLLSPAGLRAEESCTEHGDTAVQELCDGESSCAACTNCIENECFVYAAVTMQGEQCFEDCKIGAESVCYALCP